MAESTPSLRAADHNAFSTRNSASSDPYRPEGESPWTNGCAGQFGGLSRTTNAALGLTGTPMPDADEVRSRRERDKLIIAEVCADLGISRRTFYERRVKGGTPKVHHAAERQPPPPPARTPAMAARPLARQAMTTD